MPHASASGTHSKSKVFSQMLLGPAGLTNPHWLNIAVQGKAFNLEV